MSQDRAAEIQHTGTGTASAVAGEPAGAEVCELCRKPARVRLLEGYHANAPRYRLFCVACADRVPDQFPTSGAATAARRRTSLLALVAGGLVLAACGLLLEHVHARMWTGEWLIRTLAVLGGAAGIFSGALLNSPVLGATGLVVFGVAAGAEVLGVHGDPGVGWKQMLAVGGGLALALGCAVRLALGRGSQAGRST